ncbi:protein FAM13A-like isoform X2 [Antedon mediterranea]|uniref:protein FAM13A-like isoform X2 n=1 Tax=Antedon mediterranea TaxID=105859 RepID=UPI003AF50F35
MQRILRSPVNLKKKIPVSKVFGLPLAQQMQDINGEICIPFIVKKIVDFIVKHGIGHEGIFRMSGSSRIVDKLRASFDKYGDADLEEAGDVMAVAGLLKLYLRELPEAIVPDKFHQRFLAVYEETNGSNSVKQLDMIKQILDELPKQNYALLKYLSRFLVKVGDHERTNKMTPFALAIVFGPNIFRCHVGFESFKEQGIINNIVRSFIQDFSLLFEEVHDEDVDSPNYNSTIIQVKENQSLSPPQVKPRKKKKKQQQKPVIEIKDVNSNSIVDDLEDHYTNTNNFNGSSALLSPHDMSTTERSHSPFHLDSDTGTSNTATPVTNISCSELVEKTIGETISYHLFGENQDSDFLLDSPPQRPQRRKENRKQHVHESERISEDRQSKLLLDSPAFKQFERAGMLIQPRTNGSPTPSLVIPEDLLSSDLSPRAKRRQKNSIEMASSLPVKTSNRRKHISINEDDELEIIPRKTEVLSSLTAKRVTPPKNRRQPSSKQRLNKSNTNDQTQPESIHQEHLPFQESKLSQSFEAAQELNRGEDEVDKGDVNHNGEAIDQMLEDVNWNGVTANERLQGDVIDSEGVANQSLQGDQVHNGVESNWRLQGDEIHNRVALNQMLKIDIPPLDLESLHQHIDGNEPVQSWKTKVNLKTEGEALLSPRSSKLQRTSGVPEDTDVPPSPPNSQPYLKGSLRVDSSESAETKQLLKKIRGMKKKIRRFEEQFYEENGFKPSHSDKASNPDIKKIMTDLKCANKEMKKLKENARNDDYNEDQTDSRPTSEHRNLFSEENIGELGKVDALKKAQDTLEKKRQESHRTYDLQVGRFYQTTPWKISLPL